MLKLLRKHNKWILVIGGSLLMIAWLMPGAIRQIGPGRSGPVQGTLDGRKVRLVELHRSSAELNAVQMLVPNVVDNLLGSQGRDETVHWFLLAHEAEQAGYVGGPQDGADWLRELAPMIAARQVRAAAQRQYGQLADFFMQMPDAQKQVQDLTAALMERFTGSGLASAAGQTGLTIDQVHEALAKARGIERMQTAYIAAARASDRAALVRARAWGDQAMIDLLFLPADLVLTQAPEPTEEQLQAHFQKYRDAAPGAGEHGVGYLLPPRIKLEWLTLDRAAIRASVKVDPVAAHKRWQLNRDRFPGEFAQEKARVEEELAGERAGEVMQNAIQIFRAEVFKATKALDPDGQFKRIPPDWPRPRLGALAEAVQAQVAESTGIKIPLPRVTVRDADWLTEEQLAAEPELADANIRYLSGRWPLVHRADRAQPPIVFLVRELGFQTALGLQVGIPAAEYPAENAAGDLIFFSVLDARPQSAPDSLDEVRDRARDDWRKIQAFEALAARTEEFRRLAAAGGLPAVVDAFRSPDAPDDSAASESLPKVVERIMVSRKGAGRGGEQVNTEAFCAAVMDAADRIDPLSDPSAYDPVAATVAAPIPERLGVAVARITAVLPLTWERYRMRSEPMLGQELQQDLIKTGAPWPFSYEAVAARHGWTPRAGDEEEG